MEKIEQQILSIKDIDDLMKNINYEINYRTNGINQEISRINKKFADDICELNKKYDYWLDNKNFVLYTISSIIIFLNIALCLLLIIILFQFYQVKI